MFEKMLGVAYAIVEAFTYPTRSRKLPLQKLATAKGHTVKLLTCTVVAYTSDYGITWFFNRSGFRKFLSKDKYRRHTQGRLT